MQKYSTLLQHWKKIEVLRTAQSVLFWDLETYMPAGAIEMRQEQLALVSNLEHQWVNAPEFLAAVVGGTVAPQNEREKRNLELWKKSALVSSSLDAAFVDRISRTSTECTMRWRAARQDSNFKSILPLFTQLVDLCREQLERIKNNPGFGAKYKNQGLYAVAFDQYEPGLSIADMESLLRNLCEGTKKRLDEWLTKSAARNREVSLKDGQIDKNFCKQLMSDFGFNFERGRLDLSTHPFCGGSSGDVRLTTRIHPSDQVEDLFSTLHELGHALYEQGLPTETTYEPVGKACSMGVHESQSRFLENFIGRSQAFCTYLAGKLGVDAKTLFAKLNPVGLSYIRTDSDEVTYNFHVLLRLEIERDLMEGRLQVKDLPERWNTRFKELTGLTVTDDAKGCLQDTHWYSGSFGYFPSYSLGNIFAAELFADFEKQYSDWGSRVSGGEFKFVRDFMAERVYPLGARYDSPETMQKIIARKPSEQALLKYFDKKFSN